MRRRRMKILIWACCASWLLSGELGGKSDGWSPPPSPPPRNDIRMENRVAIPMRDGVILYADIYRPAAKGSYPVLVSRNPYSTEYPSIVDRPLYFASRGYVFVYQDVRGRHESEGRWEPFRNDIEDGYDTIEWAAKQPWSNGKVAMQGRSYLGHVQWRAAMASPPHLVTILPNVASTSLYHNWVTLNGGWRLSFNLGWGTGQESRVIQHMEPHSMEDGPEGISYERALWSLPLIDMPQRLGRNPVFYRDWIAHPDYDDYWKEINVEEAFERIDIPVLTLGGWFDLFSQGTLNGYIGMSRRAKTPLARDKSQMVIGPWGHGPTRGSVDPKRPFGDIDFGATAFVDELALQLRWYDYWLKGIDNGLNQELPVKLFVMGKDVWRQESGYPLARTDYRRMYLWSEGRANTYHGDGRLSWQSPPPSSRPDEYIYDPANPVPSLGGNHCCGTPFPTGPRDQRPVEKRADVLVYTSEFLEEEIEVTGPVKVILYASTEGRDTDFIAKLVDVYPDGRAFNMAEGIIRARYHQSLSQPELLEPGKIYRFEIDLVGTSVLFQAGHRIRVDITSSHFPLFDRDPNTGAPFGMSDKVKIVRQKVFHGEASPSHILLPVIPLEEVRSAR